MHMQTRVMAKGVKEELEGMFVIPNMDWSHCEQRHPVFIGWTQWSLYRGKCKGKEEYGGDYGGFADGGD